MNIGEDILHYVWKFKLYTNQLKTTDGEDIEVIDVGISNTNQGPDFFNAKIKIGEKLWAGNIEIHTESSDWYRHNHETDINYDSVILHIVKKVDREVLNSQGQMIPQCELRYPQHIDDNYDFLVHSDVDIACANFISSMPAFHLSSWMHTLLIERLERKSNDILSLLGLYNNSWEDVFYVLLSRNLGFGLNADAFERLARSLPLQYIQKHRDNIVQVEALLFGQAGILEKISHNDSYTSLLQKEYDFLAKKFQLEKKNIAFKNLRVRPSSSPIIRIAQLASLLHGSENLFSKIIHAEDVGKIRLLFHVNASEYWQTHYQFGVESTKRSKYIGDSSLDIMLINTVIPLLFTYGKIIGQEEYSERALSFMEEIKAEKNSITKRFNKLGTPLESAADSQALIQLKREYCEKKKCLYCRIGHKLLTEI